MKQEIIRTLEALKSSLTSLKRELKSSQTNTVSKKKHRNAADRIASKWVEEIRSPLEYKFNIDKEIINKTSEQMKRLHILSRPNNLKTSYLNSINKILKGFDDKFILPIKQTTIEVKELLDLQKIIPSLTNPEESNYLKEAIECAQSNYNKASIVMGWCAAIDRIQKKILAIGLKEFNSTSARLNSQTTGKFRKWNKVFAYTSLSDLQTIFDKDLIMIIEGMGLIDGNQSERLKTCFQYRNHSAHPGEAPIEPVHVISFFADINSIIFQNNNFAL